MAAEPATVTPASSSARRHLKASARAAETDDPHKTAYEQGEADARAGRPADPPFDDDAIVGAYNDGYDSIAATDDEPRHSSRRSTSDETHGGSKVRAHRARAKGRRNAQASRTYRRAAQQIADPAWGSASSAMQVLGTAVAVALLFNLLSNARYVGGFFNGVSRAVAWVDSPTKSIPYKH